jgi:pSer/pThr/pTyr-binding forkhead associated (FHA) protein
MPVGGAAEVGLQESKPVLALLDLHHEVERTYTLEHAETLIGRGNVDISFPDDQYLSPVHARLERRGGRLYVRDLGSRNGTWLFIDQPAKLADGDLLIVGSQHLRFRRLGYPGPHQPEAESTRRAGSTVPAPDIAVIQQLRADGSVRDVIHLSPGRSIALGRETGDWLFPYDASMSGKHAEVRAEDSEFFVHDARSRNGVAVAVRGECVVNPGQRLLFGDELLRVESL